MEYFSKFGALNNAYVIYMPGTEISKGFGYVEFASVEVASLVLSMRRHFIKQKKITVENHRQSYNTAMNFVQQRPSEARAQENTGGLRAHIQEDLNGMSPTFPGITFESATFNTGMDVEAYQTHMISTDVLTSPDILQGDSHLVSSWDETRQLASEFLENQYLQQGSYFDPFSQFDECADTPAPGLINMEMWTAFEPHGTDVAGVSPSASPKITATSFRSPQTAWQPDSTGRAIGHRPAFRDEGLGFGYGSTTTTRNYPHAQTFTVDPCEGNPSSVGYNHSQDMKLPGELSTGALQHVAYPLESHPNSLIRPLRLQVDSQDSLLSVCRWRGLHTSEDSNMVSKHTRANLQVRLDETSSNYRFNVSRR